MRISFFHSDQLLAVSTIFAFLRRFMCFRYHTAVISDKKMLTLKESSLADFVRGLPKAELHLHIEGTLEPELMFELAQRNRVSLPYSSVAAARTAYRQFQNLPEFLDVYYLAARVLQTELDFEELLYAYLERAVSDGVVRAELFFDPQTHTARGLTFDVFMNGFEGAMVRAEETFGISTALIMNFLRHLSVEDAWGTWKEAQPYVQRGLIIGVGLDGAELDNPNEQWKDVFDEARRMGLHCVAHAGEEGPPEFVTNTLNHLKVERVDHGVRSEEDPELLQRLVDEQIPLTICPLSNCCLKVIDGLENCHVKRLLERGVKVTLNADDPAFFGGYIADNYCATAEALDMSIDQVVMIARNSLDASFGTSKQKEAWMMMLGEYVRQLTRDAEGIASSNETVE